MLYLKLKTPCNKSNCVLLNHFSWNNYCGILATLHLEKAKRKIIHFVEYPSQQIIFKATLRNMESANDIDKSEKTLRLDRV